MTTTTATHRLTWAELVAIAPALLDIEADLRREPGKTRSTWCADRVWWATRDQLRPLVGLEALDPRVRTWAAHDAAAAHLRGLLPDCRHPGDCG